MARFEAVHGDRVVGSLAMFDRMIFRGHLMRLYRPGGVRVMLWNLGCPLTQFSVWTKAATEALCVHAQRSAEAAGRPYVYLEHATTRASGQTKQDLARGIAERDGITEGLVCVMRIVEPCRSFNLRRNHASHQLEVISRERKCVHLYWYFIDPELGFIHVRLQTWLPFGIQIYVNGREWLARQLDARGIGYLRADNALLRIDDLEAAGELRALRPPGLASAARRPGPTGEHPPARHRAGRVWQLLLVPGPGGDRHRRHVPGPARPHRRAA